MIWYTVYRAEDDAVLAIGTAQMCAKAFGWTVSNLRSMISKVKSKSNRSYAIVVEDLEAGTCVVYGDDNCAGKIGRPRKVDYNLVADLYYAKVCDADIARTLHVNPGTIWEWRTRMGLPPIGKRGRRKRADKLTA